MLLPGTYQFSSDCGPATFCSDAGVCKARGCRRDEFPFGYNPTDTLPKQCPDDEFCPDEGDACQKKLAVGSPCQLNRDDECQPPDNFKDLRGPGNNNGSICLNFQCMFANVTLGLTCIVEQMGYTAYAKDTEFIDVVSRGNCVNGLYCDAAQLICMQTKVFGAACTSDKECTSNNCKEDLTCGLSQDAPAHFGSWVYVVVGVGIFGGMIATLVTLFFIHRRTRDAEREKRVQYWREQNAFRQNIMQMRETARASLYSMGGLSGSNTPRGSVYSGVAGSEDSHMPMLHNANAPSQGSGLRNYTTEVDDYSFENEQPVMHRDHDVRGEISRQRRF